jgi:diadenosine tetraphosphate (Ap4A) HIT family hydrolase
MNWKDDRIGSAERGENPTVLLRMKSGFAVLGDAQFLPGYCVLLGVPKAGSLNDLTMKERSDFLLDMSILGDAVMSVCRPLRLNYEILGNTDSYLHAHVFPRYGWEEEARRKMPVWLYPKENWSQKEHQFDAAKHGDLKCKLMVNLKELMKNSYNL